MGQISPNCQQTQKNNVPLPNSLRVVFYLSASSWPPVKYLGVGLPRRMACIPTMAAVRRPKCVRCALQITV